MGLSSRAVIARVLADSVTPLLTRHGFGRRGRVIYERARDGRLELIVVEARHSGSFTVNLGIFIPEVDSIISLYPAQRPPQEEECHIRCRTGDVEPGGWDFDASTDLSAVGAAVAQWLERNGLGFFGKLSTRAGILAWLSTGPTAAMPWPHRVALAAYAGDPTLAQEWLDTVLAAEASSGSGWYAKSLRRKAASLAGRLGLACPAPTDEPALTAVFRVAGDTTPQDRHSAFHQLDFKLRQHVELWRTVLPAQAAAQVYHTAECTSDACTVAFYGADPEELLHRLGRAFDRLSGQFADITWHVHPAAARPGYV